MEACKFGQSANCGPYCELTGKCWIDNEPWGKTMGPESQEELDDSFVEGKELTVHIGEQPLTNDQIMRIEALNASVRSAVNPDFSHTTARVLQAQQYVILRRAEVFFAYIKEGIGADAVRETLPAPTD